MRHWRRRSMKLKGTVAVVVGLLILVGGAYAQDAKPAQPTGVKSRGLVGSTGRIPAARDWVQPVFSARVSGLRPAARAGSRRNSPPPSSSWSKARLGIRPKGGRSAAPG